MTTESVSVYSQGENMLSSPAVDEPVDATVNTENVSVGQTPTSPTVNPKPDASYANLFTPGPSRKAMNFRTLFMSSYVRAMIEVHADVEL
nr:hypothetical protein [Tanacetum cinerariifolium]